MSLFHVPKMKYIERLGGCPLIQCDTLRALEIPLHEWRFSVPETPDYVDDRISGYALFFSAADITPNFFVIPEGTITFPCKMSIMQKFRNFS